MPIVWRDDVGQCRETPCERVVRRRPTGRGSLAVPDTGGALVKSASGH